MLAIYILVTILARIDVSHASPKNITKTYVLPINSTKNDVSCTKVNSLNRINVTTIRPNSSKRGFNGKENIDTEKLKKHEIGNEKRKQLPKEQHQTNTNIKEIIKNTTKPHMKETTIVNVDENHDDNDVVYRDDDITQYMPDLFVNTDSEITSLQANEHEE